MRKKAGIELANSDKLSRLITRERLTRAGVPLGATGSDPDLNELILRVRESTSAKKSDGPTIPLEIVRKLAGS
jgi:hypothetical protein